MKVLLIVAMKDELNGFLKDKVYETKLINGIVVYFNKINNVDLYLAKCDVGKVNAAMLTTALILKIKPRYVINAGIAGGLNPSINLLDVIVSAKVAYHDFDLTAFGCLKGQMDDNTRFFNGSKRLLSLFDRTIKKGLIVSGDQFVSGIEAMNNIKNDFPKALACDMEGCAIAHVSTLLSRKFIIIRAISDNVFLKNHSKVYQDYKFLAIDKVVDVTYNALEKL